jgi:hypothetical protein
LLGEHCGGGDAVERWWKERMVVVMMDGWDGRWGGRQEGVERKKERTERRVCDGQTRWGCGWLVGLCVVTGPISSINPINLGKEAKHGHVAET